MKINSPVQIIAAFILLSVVSCQKDNSANTDIPAEVAEATANEADFTETFDDVFDNTAGIDGASAGDDLGIYGAAGFGLFPRSANQHHQPLLYHNCYTKRQRSLPQKMVLDFGTGCEMNGHVRKGKIITVYSGPLSKPGSKAVTGVRRLPD